MSKPNFINIDEIRYKIKENEKQLEAYLQLVNRTMDAEFQLIEENNSLKKLLKTLEGGKISNA